ncbi:LysR family transcriptional regulator [Sporolactobacillus sp. Y61]|jgi:LysR family transcriptional activator of glutamate synthase operon|uniref:LysR family transcriptional regulator n=1 Tax=Sporolactobacillus sp. Y61 TaxID=3160863 RepID=A0AAU8IBZ7_9BACL|nr:LysR family transcriptional regulator [Sporolactobacillus sp. THM19-2]RYL93559.1 LysR family transcriptional regulator [Sporolactobacillus sp. THM19-2]
MELRQIEYFIEAAKREHMTKAAESLHVAQSAVSRQIAVLEEELGIALFTRKGRNIQLTPAGKIFLEHAERGLIELNKARQKIREHLNPETGTIPLGISTSLSVHTLPVILQNFRKAHPGISFQLHQGTVPYLIRMIEQGRIDLAFASPVPKDIDSVSSKILYSERLVLLLPKHHLFAGRGPVSLSQLKDERFITFRSRLSLQELFREACAQAGFKPNIVFEGEDMDTIKGLVAANFGIALMPQNSVAYNLSPEITTAAIEAPRISRTVGVIRPRDRELAPSEQLFSSFTDQFYERLYRFGQ